MKLVYLICFTLLITLNAAGQSGGKVPEREPSATVLKFYPNPATSLINFDFHSTIDKTHTLQIFSFVGKKVHEVSNLSPRTVINLNNFYRGVYIFQLRDRNGKIIDSGKFQVSK